MNSSDFSTIFIRAFVAALVSFPSLILGFTEELNKSIILKPGQTYCDLKCKDDTEHTLCKPDFTKISPDCGKDFYQYKENELKDDLIIGLNGIRNRIAERMRVANMRKLKWDTELADMASIWIRKCKPYEMDPCTENKIGDDALFNQNTAYIKSKFFPPRFIPSVLSNWYLEKNRMNPPKLIKKLNKEYGTFENLENNFTQLAWASTYRFGCAIARYKEGYQIVCNYYPYGESKYAFQKGNPTSYCPNLAPLTDIFFTSLCTADDRAYSVHVNSIFIIFLLICIVCR